MSTQTLQPLSWLARSSTSPAVVSSRPAARIALLRLISALRASGSTETGWVMRDCMGSSSRVLRPPLADRQCYDGGDDREVTAMPETEAEFLAERFERHRPQLRAVAYRMLGSLTEADDAVQEGWLRLARSDADAIDNLGAWLTTVVGRVCLDMLRTRTARREDPLDDLRVPDPIITPMPAPGDPEQEAVLADAVGLALLVVLDTLAPAERLAYVLHDLFAMPFEEIAPIVDRTPTAARQLASRARRRVQGAAVDSAADRARQREVVD